MLKENIWRNCGSCKKAILLGAIYQKCSITSCRKHAFCGVDCWSHHNEVMLHKSAWAEEEKAPSSADEDRPRRRIVVSNSSGSSQKNQVPREVLVVASKLKNYVKEKHGMNTAANVMERLSDLMRFIVDDAVDQARAEGRKTLMDRDFK